MAPKTPATPSSTPPTPIRAISTIPPASPTPTPTKETSALKPHPHPPTGEYSPSSPSHKGIIHYPAPQTPTCAPNSIATSPFRSIYTNLHPQTTHNHYLPYTEVNSLVSSSRMGRFITLNAVLSPCLKGETLVNNNNLGTSQEPETESIFNTLVFITFNYSIHNINSVTTDFLLQSAC
ncbi:hypothetical protein AAFF_G00419200 [Aldrovandia affinis]|uniref:Uncharacterized protein n=1 Tax=Aldrovandia affinis TaxID=143900 RepID=A0AAD7SA91_9TELE|nr:hypothetical protein AAFF_G00419200 [Aldrovandia affinis]